MATVVEHMDAKIESDQVEITSGVRHGLTMGRSYHLECKCHLNLDHTSQKWLEIMSVSDVGGKASMLGLENTARSRPRRFGRWY